MKVSFPSSTTSPFTFTAIVALVAPAAIVRLPLAETKSVPAVAVPGAVAQSNVTALPLGAESETVNVAVVVPALPSATETSPIDRVGAASSSVMVPCPEPSAIVALAGFDRTTVKVSFASSTTSPFTLTPIVALVAPAAIVRLPLAET